MKRILILISILVLSASSAAATPGPFGQWVWSSRDADLYQSGRKALPGLQAAVWAGTIFWKDGHFTARLALSPASLPATVVVFRLDDSVNESWKDASLARREELNEVIGGLLAHVEGAGVHPSALQLDYDCPVARLADWADALKLMKQGALKNENVWITSLISHVGAPAFGKLFAPLVAGHILQVFDTGDAFSEERPAEIRKRLEAQGLPFQMGFGAFERGARAGGKVTQHREWLRNLPVFAESPLYRGAWIFPAGQPWAAALREVL